MTDPLRQCEEAFLNPDGPREYRVPEMSEEVYEDSRLTREMEMSERDIDDGGPAFPKAGQMSEDGKRIYDTSSEGMSLLDYFAGQAMQYLPLVLNTRTIRTYDSPEQLDDIDIINAGWCAKMSYEIAVAMLAERKRRMAGQ